MRSFLCASIVVCSLVALGSPRTSAGEFKLEPGFTLLFNGKDLDGWKARGGEALEGKTDAFKGRFRVAEGSIVIDYKMKGNAVIDTVKEFGKDLHIKFEFRPDTACNNDFYLRGLKFDIVPKQIKNLKVDQWNELEIIVRGDKVEYKCNGETVRTSAGKAGATPFGIRAEYGAIELRHIRAKEGS